MPPKKRFKLLDFKSSLIFSGNTAWLFLVVTVYNYNVHDHSWLFMIVHAWLFSVGLVYRRSIGGFKRIHAFLDKNRLMLVSWTVN